jgi:hypothetical protein
MIGKKCAKVMAEKIISQGSEWVAAKIREAGEND